MPGGFGRRLAVPTRSTVEHTTNCGKACSLVAHALDSNANHSMSDPSLQNVMPQVVKDAAVASSQGSLRTQAENAKSSHKVVKMSKRFFSGTCFVLHIYHVRVVMEHLLDLAESQGGQGLLLSIHLRYDETPFTVVIVDEVHSAPLPPSFESLRDMVEPMDYRNLVRDKGPTKILQTECSLTCLFRINNEYSAVTFEVAVPLSSMQRCTGECYYAAAHRLYDILHLDEAMTNRFARLQRCVCSDSDGAIDKAERALMVESDCDTLVTKDIAHVAAHIRERVTSRMSYAEQKVRHTVLALKHGHHMRIFRAACRFILSENLRIHRSRPSLQQLNRNARKLEIVLADLPENRQLRALLLAHFNGNIDDPKWIHHYASDDTSDDIIKRRFAYDVTNALCTRELHSFPGRGFNHFEKPVSWIGTMEVFNMLFSRTYRVFFQMVRNKHGIFDDPLRLAAVMDNPDEHIPAILALEDDPSADHDVDDVLEDAPAAAAPPNAAPVLPIAQDFWVQQRIDAAKHARSGYAWCVSGNVLSDAAEMCNAFFIHSKYFTSLCHWASLDWERKERHREKLRADDDSIPCRRYRLPDAYEATKERAIIASAHELLTDFSKHDIVPLASRSMSLETRVFKMATTTSTRWHAYMKQVLQNYPIKMFATINHPEICATVMQDFKCKRRIGKWATGFLQHHKDVRSMDAQMDLRSTAILARIDTIAIERNNSLLRSFVVGWAQQARVVDLGHVNDRWLGKFASNQSRGSTIWNHPYVAQPPPPPPVATDDRVADDSAVQQPPQKRKRKKSAYNMFIKEHRSGVPKKDWVPEIVLANRFTNMPDDERAPYQLMADNANASEAAGNAQPFGPRRNLVEPVAPSTEPSSGPTALAIDGFSTLAWAAIKAEQASVRATRREELANDRAMANEMLSYNEEGGRGDGIVKSVLRTFGNEQESHRFAHCPDGTIGFKHIQFRNVHLCDEAKKIAEMNGYFEATKRIRGTMLDCVGSAQSTIEHVHVPLLDSKDVKPTPLADRLCHAAQRCVCKTTEGFQYSRIYANVYSMISKMFPVGEQRQRLQRGDFAILLRGCPHNAPGADFDDLTCIWLYMPDFVLAPRQAFFHHCKVAATHDEKLLTSLRVGDRTKLTRVINRFRIETILEDYTDWEAIFLLRPNLRWDMIVYEVIDSIELIGRLQPNGCWLLPFDDGALHTIWDPDPASHGLSNHDRLLLWRLANAASDSESEHEQSAAPNVTDEFSDLEQPSTPDIKGGQHTSESEIFCGDGSDDEVVMIPLEGTGASSSSSGPASSSGGADFVPNAIPSFGKKGQAVFSFQVEHYGWLVYYRVSGWYAYCHDCNHHISAIHDENVPLEDKLATHLIIG